MKQREEVDGSYRKIGDGSVGMSNILPLWQQRMRPWCNGRLLCSVIGCRNVAVEKLSVVMLALVYVRLAAACNLTIDCHQMLGGQKRSTMTILPPQRRLSFTRIFSRASFRNHPLLKLL